MRKYRMVMSPLAWNALKRYQWSLEQFDRNFARRMRQEFSDTLREIQENPFLFSSDESIGMADKQYRRALFAKWYKIVYQVKDNTIYVNLVVDCRMDPEGIRRGLE